MFLAGDGHHARVALASAGVFVVVFSEAEEAADHPGLVLRDGLADGVVQRAHVAAVRLGKAGAILRGVLISGGAITISPTPSVGGYWF